MYRFSFAVLLCLDPLLLGCGYTENGTVSGLPMQSQKIKHIVVIMQENRSFDNLFHGFPGADTVDSGQSNGKPVALQPVRIEQGTDVDHSMQVGGKTGTTERWTDLPTQNIPFLTFPTHMSLRKRRNRTGHWPSNTHWATGCFNPTADPAFLRINI
jgi:hypothetical protein